MVFGWDSPTKATGSRAPSFIDVTDTQAGVTKWWKTGWVLLSPLPLSSFNNLASASLHRDRFQEIKKGIRKVS